MVSGAAHLFDGRTSARHDVWWQVVGDQLHLAGSSIEPLQWPLAALHAGENWHGLPWPVVGPDGATLWLPPDALPALRPCLNGGRHRSIAASLSASWPAALVCLALLIALLGWFDRQGASIAARWALHVVPESVDSAIGEQSLALLDANWFTASTVAKRRQQRLRNRFTEAALRHEPRVVFRVEFRRLKDEAGFNAFALPGGTIVLLDGMTEELGDDEVMAVLGHELGHVAHRHALQGLMRSFGLLAVAGTLFGDFSQVAATTVATLQGLRHQRDDEREADAFGARFAGAMGLSPEAIRSLWRKARAEEQAGGADVIPAWLSTHPSTEERLRAVANDPPASATRNPQ